MSSLSTVGVKNDVRVTASIINTIGKVCSLEYSEIPKMFLTPHHGGDISRATKIINSATVSKATM
jgi:hypothetical protein